RGLRWVDEVRGDLAYGLRGLARSPGFACSAVVTLALGIGATSTLFTFVNSVLLKMLPAGEPERLRLVQWSILAKGGRSFNRSHSGSGRVENGRLTRSSFAYAHMQQLREQVRSIDLLGFSSANINISINGVAQAASGHLVSWNFFDVLGVHTVVGRSFAREEEREGMGEIPGVISHYFWTRAFANDPGVVGRAVAINGAPAVGIGIGP